MALVERLGNISSGTPSRSIEVAMKYVPIWVPVILILGLVAVRLYRPPPVGGAAGASRAPIACEPSSTCR
jgi:hypothetical protein